MPTIKDLAREAGVSSATASRALTGHPHVSPETRARVLRVAQEIGYQPDQVARSLRRRRSNLIGLVISTVENVFFTELARAAEQAALRHGYSLIVCNTDEIPEREEAYVSVLDRLLVAGIILAPAPGGGQHLTRFLEQGPPIVLVNRYLPGLPCCAVVANDGQAAYECVGRLIQEGRRRIAAITGLPGASTTVERLNGYRRALRAGGLPVQPELEVCGLAHLVGGCRAARQVMQQPNPPDALFAFNNLMTQGTVMALQDLGLHWPHPVDVAGFGAFEAARLYCPPLTLIAQPSHEMGERAVETLIDQVEGRTDRKPRMLVLHNRLLPREEWLTPVDGRSVEG